MLTGYIIKDPGVSGCKDHQAKINEKKKQSDIYWWSMQAPKIKTIPRNIQNDPTPLIILLCLIYTGAVIKWVYSHS